MLITDAIRGMGLPEGTSWQNAEGEEQLCVVMDGVAKLPRMGCFAGSVAPADRLVRTMVQQAGLPLPKAVSMITKNPARMLKIKNKGEIKVGFDADLVLLNEDLTTEMVILGGNVVDHSDLE